MKQSNRIWEATCLVCEEGISNPICGECLAQEITDLLAHNTSVDGKDLASNLGTVKPAGNEKVRCVLCGRKISVCSYCMLNDMLDTIKDTNPSLKEAIEDHMDCYSSLF